MSNSILRLTNWWSQIGLVVKRRKRGTRGGIKPKPKALNKTFINKYSFPSILYTNACSLNTDKLDVLMCLSLDFDILAITETWNNDTKNISLNNFELYETRRNGREGGGTAIFVRNNLQSTRYNNFIHNNSKEYEITCVITRPNYLPRSVSVLVVVCVYLPPNCIKPIQFKLLKSLLSIFENIRNKYVSPGYIVLGDFNNWKCSSTFSSVSGLFQSVDFPTFFRDNTNSSSKLDKIFTNVNQWYEKPSGSPPLKSNVSYHVCIMLKPTKAIQLQKLPKKLLKYRVYTKENLHDFATLVENFNWKPFFDSDCIDFKVNYMNLVIEKAFQITFPEKRKTIYINDNLWVTKALHERIKSFKKVSKTSAVYNATRKDIFKEIKLAKEKYKERIQSKINSKPDSIHSFVNNICLLKPKISAVEKIALSGKIPTSSALNQINEHFCAISTRYEAIREINFIGVNSANCLHVNEFSVLRSFEKLNLHKSNVPGALPAQFLKFAAVHIVPYYTHVVNYSFKHMKVPSDWKKGYITPIQKNPNNISVDSLRPITQTNIYSKIMEQFMFEKIYNQVINKLDTNQYGAVRRSSTAYYLVSLFNFVFKSLEKPNTYVVVVLLDLSKAFDLVDHNILKQCLIDIGVCKNDIMWIADFLRNRQQCTKHLNQTSKFLSITNSTPRGTKLAILLFIVLINDLLTKFYSKHASPDNILNAFVDDMCIAEAVSYNQTPKINTLVKDLNDRMLHNKMSLNAQKSMVIVIDNSKDKKFSNVDIVINGDKIPKVNASKLLGVLINTKADWNNHVDSIYSKACKKLFILRRLKCFGFSRAQLTNLYMLHIRSILEYCSVLWSSSLTVNQTKRLVSVEKRALSIISGKYVCTKNYLSICNANGLRNLIERWSELLANFGIQTMKNERFKHWLESYKIHRKEGFTNRTNSNLYPFRAVPTKFERYRRSTIPALVKLLREKF